MELELKHIKGYLDTKLKIQVEKKYYPFYTIELQGISLNGVYGEKDITPTKFSEIKLKLHPLSDLTKHCEDLGFVPIEKINDFAPIGKNFGFSIEIDNLGQTGYRTPESWINPLQHILFLNKLYEWHFDIHGLIPAGLAISINDVAQADA